MLVFGKDTVHNANDLTLLIRDVIDKIHTVAAKLTHCKNTFVSKCGVGEAADANRFSN